MVLHCYLAHFIIIPEILTSTPTQFLIALLHVDGVAMLPGTVYKSGRWMKKNCNFQTYLIQMLKYYDFFRFWRMKKNWKKFQGWAIKLSIKPTYVKYSRFQEFITRVRSTGVKLSFWFLIAYFFRLDRWRPYQPSFVGLACENTLWLLPEFF